MSNKRKPKVMDFGFTSKNTKNQAKKPSLELEDHSKEKEIPQDVNEETKNNVEIAKPNAKPKKTFGKFNLKLKEDIIEENLAESEKIELPKEKKTSIIPKKAPVINIINEDNEKVEEKNKSQKTSILKPSKKPMKKIVAPVLSIDTEQINEIYSYGGEKGKRIAINADELSEEYREISELAILCVRHMSKFNFHLYENLIIIFYILFNK